MIPLFKIPIFFGIKLHLNIILHKMHNMRNLRVLIFQFICKFERNYYEHFV